MLLSLAYLLQYCMSVLLLLHIYEYIIVSIAAVQLMFFSKAHLKGFEPVTPQRCARLCVMPNLYGHRKTGRLLLYSQTKGVKRGYLQFIPQ